MAESSYLWSTNGVGDGINSGYTQDNITEIFRALFGSISGADLGGVVSDYLNELAVTGSISPVSINSGMAVAYGFIYKNTSPTTIDIPNPVTSTRIDRIVVEVNWTAQTVRLVRAVGTEGGAAPALTQVAGTTWQIAVANISIAVGGAITIIDQREYVGTVDAATVFAMVLALDGSGSGLNADLLDGSDASAFSTTAHTHTGVYATSAHTHEVDQRADVFNDGEGNPGAVSNASNDGTSTYGARRDHIHTVANSAITYAALSRHGGVPIMSYRPGANQDFTTVVTADFDTTNYDADALSLISNNGAGEITFNASCFVEFHVSGYFGHATGTSELWAQLWVDHWNGSSWNTIFGTSRVVFIPTSNWNSFFVMGVQDIVSSNKLRCRMQRAAGGDQVRMSSDSTFFVKILTA